MFVTYSMYTIYSYRKGNELEPPRNFKARKKLPISSSLNSEITEEISIPAEQCTVSSSREKFLLIDENQPVNKKRKQNSSVQSDVNFKKTRTAIS